MAKQPAKGQKTAKSTPAKATTGVESSDVKGPVIDAIPAEVHATPAEVTNALDGPKFEQVAGTLAEKPTEAAPQGTDPEPVEPPQAPATASATPAPATQGPGFLPLLLGGLLAGVLGYAVATFTAPANDTSLADQMATQEAALQALEDRVANTPQIDLSGIETEQAALTTQVETLETQLADLAARVTDLADRPVTGGGNVTIDSTDVQVEMDALRAQIAEMTGAAQTELQEARAAAAAIEENAAAAARDAAGRAALARVQTALESGAPIGAALGDLEEALGASAPDALLAVQDGVPTLAALQESFPEVARAALTSARSEGVAGEETGGIGAFIRNQFDVRSTTPQDGDGADAVLSRAEAAVRAGRLSDALAEISALPEVARGAMSDWLAQAETRADAIAAVDLLSTSLSDN